MIPDPADAFRLLCHSEARGARNMAIDEAIGLAVGRGESPPTLRFYAWDPPCVSLGRSQPFDAVDEASCTAHGYETVRRPTGGRAILHTDELTYSLIAPPDHRLMLGMVLDSYLRIAKGLLAGLDLLGISATAAPGTTRTGRDVSAACFEVPSAYEIVAGDRKLLGSAQTRRSDFVLQHGSLPLCGDLTRLVDCLRFASDQEREQLRSSLAGHATTVEALLGRPVTFAEARQALAAGICESLAIQLDDGELSDLELSLARDLSQTKYDHPSWTRLR
jgi:lipoyl(octanoyl) transferase